jgi:DNA polymerase III epsilon subunit-like protein
MEVFMITLFKGVEYKNVLVFDAEYNEGDLIQFTGLLFRQIEKDIFQIEKSLNIYVKSEIGKSVNPFIEQFTGITNNFLEVYGETLDEAIEAIYSLVDVPAADLLVVSHGIQNDRQILVGNGVDLYVDKDGNEIDSLCTYNAARRLLNRDKKLNLVDVAAESGFFLSGNHNAFEDAWATVSVLCLMCKLEEERRNEKILQPRENTIRGF